MEAKEISKAVIKRLPRYYRYLGELMEENVERISSNDLSKKMHVTASQIRQDLNNFGGFGQQGYGYNVRYLYTEIGKILGLDTVHPMIILGAGNLGQALANYVDFNVNVGMHTHDVIEGNIKATHHDDGEKYKLCKYCDEYKGYMNDYNAYETVALSKTSYTYDGKEKKPGVTVTDWLGDPISKSEYTVTYPKSAKNVGKYTVTIKFKNHYAGTEKRTFTINPKGTSVSKVTSPKKAQLKVTWKKQATQTTGYQVQYSTDKNFKKGNKTVTVKGAKTTAKTISKLTKGKKYYVRVRTYKTVNKTNFYSGWSKSSSVTVKK